MEPWEQMKFTAAQQEFENACFRGRPSIVLGLKPYIDGDKYCVCYGENVQVGVCGFGVSPDEAMRDFDTNWYKKL